MTLKTTHTDKNGNTILIVCLEKQHLINIIRWYCKRIVQLTALLEDNNFKGRCFFEATNPDFKVDKKKIATLISRAHEDLAAYNLEATVRGLNVYIVKNIQEAYGRTESLENIVNKFDSTEIYSLGAHNDDDDDDDDDDEKVNWAEWSNLSFK
jgi:hypothetical protein